MMHSFKRNFCRRFSIAFKTFLLVSILLALCLQVKKALLDSGAVLKIDYKTWRKVVYRLHSKGNLQEVETGTNYMINISQDLTSFKVGPSVVMESGKDIGNVWQASKHSNTDDLYYKLSNNGITSKLNSGIDHSWTKASTPVDPSSLGADQENGRPIILVWWPPTWKNLPKNKQFYLERSFQGECGNCRLTMNRRLLNQSKVVVFDNLPNAANLNDLPPYRTAEQAYVLWHRETPAKTFHLRSAMVGVFDTMFNYTMSYRRDSDFRWYSGNIPYTAHSWPKQAVTDPQLYIDEIIKSKRRLATWVVSNCNNTRGAVERKKYVFKLLEAGLKIDMYGKCFGQRIMKNNFTTFLSSYKFYLAFENSWHCRDYVTEKFWRNGIMAGVVPVVWGPTKEDVAEVAPVGSYIHIEDFESPKALVDYLIYLDKNDHEYRKYFNWRKTAITEDGTEPMQTIRPGYEAPLCQMCRRIIQSKGKLPKRVLNSTLSWVFGNMNNTACLLYDVYPN